jgi:hypothetical protein
MLARLDPLHQVREAVEQVRQQREQHVEQDIRCRIACPPGANLLKNRLEAWG